MTDVATDYGLYLFQGPNPASGTDTLLYIGKANGETFGARFSQADRLMWDPEKYPTTDNVRLMRFFTGRILPTTDQPQDAIDDELWGEYIDKAEKLLIAAHAPPWNAQGVGGIPAKKAEDYDDCHILNWGTRASLLPEVSGVRHSWAVFNGIGDNPLRWTEE